MTSFQDAPDEAMENDEAMEDDEAMEERSSKWVFFIIFLLLISWLSPPLSLLRCLLFSHEKTHFKFFSLQYYTQFVCIKNTFCTRNIIELKVLVKTKSFAPYSHKLQTFTIAPIQKNVLEFFSLFHFKILQYFSL